jgi:predicted metalloprotease
MEMQQTLGIEEATFTYAYVLAHEVGHHVQHLLGDLDRAHQQMARLGKAEGNRVSVQIELQADFYAGVWGHDEQKLFNSLEKGDLEKALDAALKIGDDYLQKKAQGRADERTFTHGTSVQRQRWFKRGFQTGDLSQGNTFSVPYNQL